MNFFSKLSLSLLTAVAINTTIIPFESSIHEVQAADTNKITIKVETVKL